MNYGEVTSIEYSHELLVSSFAPAPALEDVAGQQLRPLLYADCY
jgi:hypothetical protein